MSGGMRTSVLKMSSPNFDKTLSEAALSKKRGVWYADTVRAAKAARRPKNSKIWNPTEFLRRGANGGNAVR